MTGEVGDEPSTYRAAPGSFVYEALPRHSSVEAPTMMSQRAVLTIALVGGLLLATAIGVLLYVSFHLANQQAEATRERRSNARSTADLLLFNRENGLRSRAVFCEGQYVVGLRFTPDSPCLSADVLRYWSPDHLHAFVPRPTGGP